MVGNILIVDDVATNRIVMKVKLNAAGYRPVMAQDGAGCIALAASETPDLILLDLALPDMSGVEVLRRLRADPATRTIPVVMFSSSQDAAARAAAFRAGADDFLTKPIDDQTLLARIRSFMRARETKDALARDMGDFAMLGLAEASQPFEMPGRIALVMARSETAMLMRRELTGQTANRITVMSADEAFAEGLKPGGAPDVFVIEADLAATGDGLRLMSDLRSRANTRHAAFCLLVPPGVTAMAPMAYDLGANDLVSVAVAPQELALRLARLLARKREADRLRASVQDGLRLAVIDPLTGLHNRRYGIAQLSAICERARKSAADFAVMVVDLDRFKAVNDRWGHGAGDAVLIDVAGRLSANLRNGDLLARIGGEEFLIALPDTTLAEARVVAERLCQVVGEAPVLLAGGLQVQVTVSIGLAISTAGEMPCQFDTVSEIVDRADRALLVAKSAGRNQVTISRTAA